MEDSTIEFQVERKCDLTKIGDKLDNKVLKNPKNRRFPQKYLWI